MRTKLISLCAMCVFPFLMSAQAPHRSSHHQLTSSVGYPLSIVSPEGRYMGGWMNGMTYIYDTQTEKTVTTLGGDGSSVYLVKINEDGSLWASRIDNNGLNYGLYKDGSWTELPKPEGFQGGWLRHVTSDGKYALNSYTNTMDNNSLASEAYLYTRNDAGTYEYQKLTKPKNDCWTESEVFHVDPMQISHDGKIILGHMVDGLSNYIFPIIWEKNSNGEYEYRIKGESICFNLDNPSPGNPPMQEEMVTAPEGTPEYDQQMAEYSEAVDTWNAAASAFFSGYAIGGYPKMNPNATTIGTSLFTGDQTKGDHPLLMSITDDSYKVIEYNKTKTNLVTDNGTAFLLCEPAGEIPQNLVYISTTDQVLDFSKWMKETYGLTLESDYVHNLKTTVGYPAISEDGKTLAFTLQSSDGMFKNHYYRLDEALNEPTSIATPEANKNFRVYTNGKTLFINNDSTPCDIRIIDTTGKDVARHTNVVETLSLNQLAAGVYVAAVTCNGKTEFFKIMLAD